MSKNNWFSVAVLFVWLYAGSYLLTEWIPVPLVWYFPLEQRWEMAIHPSAGLKMGWYGKVLVSLLSASLGALLLAAFLRWSQRELPEGLQGFLDLCAMSTVVFALLYIARSLSYRVVG